MRQKQTVGIICDTARSHLLVRKMIMTMLKNKNKWSIKKLLILTVSHSYIALSIAEKRDLLVCSVKDNIPFNNIIQNHTSQLLIVNFKTLLSEIRT